MTKSFKLAIVRARHDISIPTLSDQACLEMLMTGPNSLLRFWEDTTGEWFDFLNSAMLPWVDFTIDPAKIGDRGGVADLAITAVRDAHPGMDPFAGFDGAFIVAHPGQISVPNPLAGQPGQPATMTAAVNGGSITVGVPLKFSLVASQTSDLTFMSHELGHVLGFDHTFGLLNNGTDYDPNDKVDVTGPEYGSPYDLMSSATFGRRWLGAGPTWTATPTFTGTAVDGWPAASAGSMGPHLSRANLHRWFPGALDPGHTVHRDMPAPGAVLKARIVAASSPANTTLVLHPPGEPDSGVGRVYVEYRDDRGWDRGMRVGGTDLAQVGVVVHRIEDTAVGPRVWYHGSIPTGSIDTDIALLGSIVVSVDAVGSSNGNDYADISVQSSIDTAVKVVSAQRDEGVVGGSGTGAAKQTPCGETITWGTWDLQTSEHFVLRTTGLGGTVDGSPARTLTADWTVGGVALAAPSGQIEVPADGVTYPVDYQIDPVSYELTLSTGSGGVRFQASVIATVHDGRTAMVSAPAEFVSRGWYDGYSPDDEAKLVTCLGSRLQVIARPDLIPPFTAPVPLEIGLPALTWRTTALARIAALQLDAPTADALQALVLLQAPPELDPPSTPDAVIAALGAVGVDYSVDLADLQDWLGDAADTPYPALAQALLTLLAGSKLRQPAYLDVIAYDYENAPGATSPRAVADVDTDRLRAAVLAAYNERNGLEETAFDALLGP